MEYAIEIKDLEKSYGKKPALDGVTFNIKKGHLTGYIGPNGAGKTTTINIIMGIIEKDKGSVKIFGEEISNKNIELKRLLGYVPETPYMYRALTPYEYLTFVGKMYDMDKETLKKRIDHYMEYFQLSEYEKQLIHSLSKGNIQKTLVISGILHDPEIYFFDEPVNGLDINGQYKFKQLLSELINKGKTVVYSSHIVEIVEKLSKDIIIIDRGKIQFQGEMTTFIKNANKNNLEEALLDVLGNAQ
ncbi:ABC transporter ATP-binding protein [bacterium]|nr:ABC transporter ATP-binding protein [bacterium]